MSRIVNSRVLLTAQMALRIATALGATELEYWLGRWVCRTRSISTTHNSASLRAVTDRSRWQIEEACTRCFRVTPQAAAKSAIEISCGER
jgi:plasmid maintenance system antidote protein VapI